MSLVVEEIAELTPLASSLAYLQQTSRNGADPYLVQVLVTLTGPVDADRLREAVMSLAARHDLLRASIRTSKHGNSLFVIATKVDVPFEVETCPSGGLTAALDADLRQGMDLSHAPLWRVRLIRSATDTTLCITVHHTIIDGTSTSILLNDLFLAYTGQPWPTREVPRYSDHLAFVGDVESPDRLGVWRDALTDVPAPCLIDASTREGGFAGDRVPTGVTTATLADVAEWSRSCGFTLRTAIDAAWALTLSSTIRTDRVVFGTVVSTRKPGQAGHDLMVGPYVNMVPRVAVLDPRMSVLDLLADIEERRLRTLDAEDAGLAAVQRARGIGTLFDTAVAFENYERLPSSRHLDADTRVDSVTVRDATHYPISLVVVPDRGAHLLVDPQRVDHRLAKAVAELFSQFLTRLAQHQHDPLTRVRAADGKPTHAEDDASESPLTEFFAWARRTPEAEAVSDGERTYTYSEAAASVEALATELVDEGLPAGSVVAVAARRSADLPLALLGVAAAGGVFVCLDVESPRKHLSHILRQSEPTRVLVDDLGAEILADIAPHLDQRDLRPRIPHQQSLRPDVQPWHGQAGFCTIFTSGSTGTPKGVLLSHARTSRAFELLARANSVSSATRWLSVSAISFDLALCELLIPLTVGGHGHVGVPGIGRDVDQLADLIKAWSPTMLSATPLLWGALLQEHPRIADNLAGAMTVGEAPPSAVVTALREAVPTVTNGYGPTETTICASIGLLRPDTQDVGRINEGYEAYILDPWLRPLPPYVLGELHVAGDCLAVGYLGAAGLTAERFIANPFGTDGSRLYRTGDLGYLDRLGVLHLQGRADGQLKIRGNRVELGEVEQALLRCGAQEAACVPARRRDGTLAIAAFVTGDASEPVLWRTRLRRIVPDYMVPTAIVPLDSLPANTSGKVDRAELARLGTAALAREVEDVADDSEDPVVAAIVEEFASVLGRSFVGADSDFFALGGHSLTGAQVISRLRRRLRVDLAASALFEAPTPTALAGMVRAASAAEERPVAGGANRAPVTASQRMVWLAEKLSDGGAAYGGGLELLFPAPVDEYALTRAVDGLRDRHRILRSTFHAVADGVEQRVTDLGPLPLLVVTVPPDANTDAEVTCAFRSLVARPFDLTHEPPLRIAIAPWDGHRQRVLLVTHHIAVDGHSMTLLLNDLARGYTSPDAPAAPRLQFTDLVAWLGTNTRTRQARLDTEWWIEHLRDLPETLPLPYRSAGEIGGPLIADRVSARLTRDTHADLEKLAARTGTTLSTVLLAGLAHVLSSLTGSREVPIGLAVSGQADAEFDDVIGMFVNTVVVRAVPGRTLSVSDLVSGMRGTLNEVLKHQQAPLDAVVAGLREGRTDPGNPLVRVYTSHVTQPALPGDAPFEVGPVVGSTKAKFEISVDFVDQRDATGNPNGINLEVEFAANLFDREVIVDLVASLAGVYANLGTDPDAALPGATTPDQVARLERWGTTDKLSEVPIAMGTLASLWQNVATLGPAPAVIDATRGECLSYDDLRDRVASARERLLTNGVGRGGHIALLASDGALALPWILAAWSLGAAYTPLDPDASADRSARMVQDCGATLILREAHLESIADGIVAACGSKVSCIDATVTAHRARLLGVEDLHPDDPAYTLFTSGSTGAPKGATVHIAGLENHVRAKIDLLGLTSKDVIMQNAPLTFDVSIWQLITALVVGGAVICVDRATAADPHRLREVAERHGATVLEVVPSFLRASLELFRHERASLATSHLRWLLSTGEVLPVDLARAWLDDYPDVPLVNAYGPTECSDDITHEMVVAAPPLHIGGAAVAVGTPVSGARIHLLDEHLAPTPPGWIGEVYVEGLCVGHGYTNNPARTAESFVASVFTPGERMYRTGDLARWGLDGKLVYVGRRDQQIKIRGQRVEILDVEAALRAMAGVADAAVVPHRAPTGDLELVAFLVSKLPETDLATAASRLASAFVPARIHRVDDLPKSTTGKVDRRLLAARAAEGPKADPAHRGPTAVDDLTDPVRRVAEAFGTVLGTTVGPEEDFFSHGGDSIRAIQLAALLKASGIDVSPNDVMRAPTPARLSALAAVTPVEVVRGSGRFTMPPSMRSTPLDVLLAPEFSQYAVVHIPSTVDDAALEHALTALVRRHDALRLQVLDNGDLFSSDPGHASFALSSPQNGDPRDPAALRAAVVRLRADLAPREGRLMAACTVVGAGTERTLVLVVHHVAVDAASWGILLPELFHLAQGGEPGDLPTAPSYRSWAENQMAALPRVRDEEAYWAAQNSGGSLLHPTAAPTAADAHSRGSVATGPEVGRTIRSLARSLAVSEQDVVTAGVLVAIRTVREAAHQPDTPLTIGVETPGRSGALGLPADAVVGWVASVHPLLVEPVSDGKDILGLVRAVHAARAAAPHGGAGYGLVMHHARERAASLLHPPAVVVNFLGAVEGDIRFGEWTLAMTDLDDRPISDVPVEVSIRRVSDGDGLILTWVARPDVAGHPALESFSDHLTAAFERLGTTVVPDAAAPSPDAALPLSGTLLSETEAVDAAFQPLVELKKGTGTPLFCIHGGVGLSLPYLSLTPYVETDTPVYGIQAFGVPDDTPTMADLARHYLDRIAPLVEDRPVRLLGWSFGGNVAFEMACQLQEAGREVGWLGILDQFPTARAGEDPSRQEILHDLLVLLGYDVTAPEIRHAIEVGGTDDILAATRTGILAQVTATQFNSVMRSMSRHHRLIDTFRPRQFDGDIHVVVAQHELVPGEPSAELWEPWVSGKVVRYDVATDHDSILAEHAAYATRLLGTLNEDGTA